MQGVRYRQHIDGFVLRGKVAGRWNSSSLQHVFIEWWIIKHKENTDKYRT